MLILIVFISAKKTQDAVVRFTDPRFKFQEKAGGYKKRKKALRDDAFSLKAFIK